MSDKAVLPHSTRAANQVSPTNAKRAKAGSFPSLLLYVVGRFLLRLCIVYGLFLLLMMMAEEKLLIPAGRAEYAVSPLLVHEEIDIPVPGASRSAGDFVNAWYLPYQGDIKPMFAEGRPFVIYCHGNAGTVTLHVRYAEQWRQELGADVVIFDYRGFGRSPGLANEKGMYEDARAVYDWCTKTQRVDPRRIVIVGRSLGGAVAIALASQVDYRDLCILDTFTNAPAAAEAHYPFIPASAIMRNRFPSIDRIGKLTRPLFLAYGTKDMVVPNFLGQKLFEQAMAPKELLVRTGMGHYDPLTPSEFAKIRTFLLTQK